jgi:hypothetical protein
MHSHIPVSRHATAAEHQMPQRRALQVTAFISEVASSAPQFAMLSVTDLNLPTAIVPPMPQLPDIQPIASDSFARAREMATSDDLRTAEQLQGLYVGQIMARLLRLLEDVADSGSVPAGNCVVYVVQNESGQVLDVMSDECEWDAYRRHEIENAIRRASPLPLPPEGLAMGSYLTLDLSTL